jgi:hypothetical protein
MNENIWAITLIAIVATVCVTLMYLNDHPYKAEVSVALYADDNVVEIMKSINYTAISQPKLIEAINKTNLTEVPIV